MATTTTNLGLTKPSYLDESDIADINDNMDTLDTAIKAVQDATATLEAARQNLNSLMGNLGLDANGKPLVNAAAVRTALDVAQSGGATTTLKALQDSVDNLSWIAKYGNLRQLVFAVDGDYAVIEFRVSTRERRELYISPTHISWCSVIDDVKKTIWSITP